MVVDEYGLDTKLSNKVYLGGQVALDMFINVPCMYSDVFIVYIITNTCTLQLVLVAQICRLIPFPISSTRLFRCVFAKSHFMM